MSAADPAVRAVLDLLTRAARDRNAGPLRWPVLASVDPDGGADARMLVLRGFEREARILELHTDARAPKAAQLTAEPRCTLIFFDPRSMVQVRVRGQASVHAGDEVARLAFERAPEQSLSDYRGAAPGRPLEEDPASSEDAWANFAAIRLRMLEADYLKLSRSGHERVHVDFSGEAAKALAVAP